ncbi:MAG: pilus assembly protein CpaE [Chloroflexota bacterium]|nr:pilus assembly protein CpaE [Chloroflexota bacterium]
MAFKDAIRIVLVDPFEGTRQALQQLIGGVGEIWLADVCSQYKGTEDRVAEVSPDMVIVVLDSDPLAGIQLIQTILQKKPGVAVLPASRDRDSGVILRSIRAGAREFLPLPTEANDLLESVKRLIRPRDETQGPGGSGARGPQIITITGASGGVGCTSLAVNLGTTLAKSSSHEAILADFDLLFGSVDACLDIIPDQTLQGVLQSIDRLDLTLLKRSLTRHGSGLYVLPHPVAMEDAAKIDPEGLRRLLTLLKAAFPSVIIDTSKGLQSSDFVAYEMSDVILVVLQLDLTCLRNTARLLQLFQQFDGLLDRVKLIVNRAGSHDAEISLKKAEETLRMPVSWQIPNATKLFFAARAKGVPIDAIATGSRSHQAMLQIVRAIRPFPAAEEAKPRKGLFAAFF